MSRRKWRPHRGNKHGRRLGVRGHELDRFEGGVWVRRPRPDGTFESFYIDEHGRRIEPGEQQEQTHGDESV